jgi:hypothetical protein
MLGEQPYLQIEQLSKKNSLPRVVRYPRGQRQHTEHCKGGTMLQVELDIFSGMPNPTWILTDKEERALLDRIMAKPELMLSSVQSPGILGYRGMVVSLVKEDDNAWSRTALASGTRLPHTFRIGGLSKESIETASWMLTTSEKTETSVDDFLREVAQTGISTVTLESATVEEGGTQLAGAGMCCSSNYLFMNASTFNLSTYISTSNCYCFASNHPGGGRWAKPGRRGGYASPSLSPSDLGAGLARDGWKGSCVPLRNLMIALVVWPNYDFHFYRLVRTNSYLWGHKPGGTSARYTDNSGNYITEPAICNRGGYTSFYGYWYQDNYTAYVS